MIGGISIHTPMRVVSFLDFQRFGRLPRSSDRVTQEVSALPSNRNLVYISHRWLRPGPTQEEHESHGYRWAGHSHPDDEAGSKHKIICAGIQKLAEMKAWSLNAVYLWIDFCCVEQDDVGLLQEGVASIKGYIAMCDAMLIPSPQELSEEDGRMVHMIPGGYGERAWTRLESMCFFTVRLRNGP
jgi:hypothetical protein